VIDARLAEEGAVAVAAFTAEPEPCCPSGLGGTLMVVPGEFTGAETYGALAADARHGTGVGRATARGDIALITRKPARARNEPRGRALFFINSVH
jgi:hypothetical protein